jgi:FMN-dependent NADH-azoreductase
MLFSVVLVDGALAAAECDPLSSGNAGCSGAATLTILHLDASNNYGGHSRRVSQLAVDKVLAAKPGATVVRRDISVLPHLPNGAMSVWKGQGTPTDEQKALMAFSDTLCAEAFAADIIVIGSPMYNFGPSTGMKSWIDHVARVGVTVPGPGGAAVGLLENKKAIVVCSSGGTKMGAPRDFHTPWLRVGLAFVGVKHQAFVPVRGGVLDEAALVEAVANL